MPLIKTAHEIDLMRHAGHMLFEVLTSAEALIADGISTLELDTFLESEILKRKCRPAFKGYNGFPATACISINEEVVHGIPTSNRKLKSGQLLKIDLGLVYQEIYSDMARSYLIDSDDRDKLRLIRTARECCEKGGELARDGMKLGTLGNEIQRIAEDEGYSVVRDYVGHGIGRALHEDPQVPNYGLTGTGFLLKKGMVICIEPMVNEGTFEVRTKKDGWTVVTKDEKQSAHWENMYLVGDEKGERLTV